MAAHPLDNPVWHALTGPHHALGERRGRAARFDVEVTPFAAIEDGSTEAWGDLADLVGPGGVASLFSATVEPPSDWELIWDVPCGQLVAERVRTDGESAGVADLGPGDVQEMLDLVNATKPGPFGMRTIALGGYVGVRDDDGRLVAMAGERLRGGGFTEVSAVCTVPDRQGEGLGTRLVRAVVERIRARGEEAYLHVADTNVGARRLYLAMGFVERCKPAAHVLRAPVTGSG